MYTVSNRLAYTILFSLVVHIVFGVVIFQLYNDNKFQKTPERKSWNVALTRSNNASKLSNEPAYEKLSQENQQREKLPFKEKVVIKDKEIKLKVQKNTHQQPKRKVFENNKKESEVVVADLFDKLSEDMQEDFVEDFIVDNGCEKNISFIERKKCKKFNHRIINYLNDKNEKAPISDILSTYHQQQLAIDLKCKNNTSGNIDLACLVNVINKLLK